MLNKIIFFFLACMVSSCAYQDNAKYLREKIRKQVKDNYAIPNGEIIAKFDLSGIESDDKIFSTFYGKAITTNQSNQLFLASFVKTYKVKNAIEINAEKKYNNLCLLLSTLNDKYKILGTEIGRNVKKGSVILSKKSKSSQYNKLEYFKKITNLHNNTKYLPLYPPVDLRRITSNFGPRIHPRTKKKAFHRGLDIAGSRSCIIRTAGDGVVEEVSRVKGYGNNIVIKHSNNIKTRYAHLSKIAVQEGDKVILGQKIGIQGLSGTSRGEHLHFEVLVRNKPVNPKDFIGKSM